MNLFKLDFEVIIMIQIRRASIADVDELLSISQLTFVQTFGPHNTEQAIKTYLTQNLTLEKLATELVDPRAQFFVAIDNGQMVGYLKVNEFGSQTESGLSNSLEVQRIYVLKKDQSKKVGQELMKLAIKIAHELKVNYVWLGVWENNTKAITFYERFGFRKFAIHTFHMGTHPQNDLLMKLIM